MLKSNNYEYVYSEMARIKETAKNKIVKIIIETCLLEESEKIKMCELVVRSGVDFIKTSTGFSTSGASFADIELFKEYIKGEAKIKASGGIKNLSELEKFIELGADRIGTSSAIDILNLR